MLLVVARFHSGRLSVSKGFERQLDDATKRGLARALKTGEQIVDSKWTSACETTNGWPYTSQVVPDTIRFFVLRSPSMKSVPNSPTR